MLRCTLVMVCSALFVVLSSAGCTGLQKTVRETVTNKLRETPKGRSFAIENSWTRMTTRGEFFGFRRLNRMTPLVTEELVVQANAIDGIIAYGRKDGVERWRLPLVNGVEGGAQVVGDRLYFGASDGNFYAVNLNNGQTVWTFPVHAETLAAPTVEGGIVYFESGADVVYALDASTGKQVWVYNRQLTGNLSIRATTRPTVAGEKLLVGFSDGFVVALRKRDGGLIWERKIGKSNRFRDVDATPVVDGSEIYVASFDAALYSLNLETGDVNWTLDDGAYVPVTLGAGRFADRLFYSTAGGKIYSVQKATGRVLTTIPIKKGIATQVSLFRGFIVYGESEGSLIIADAEKGQQVAKFDPGYGIVARPAVIDGTGEAFFLSNGANLYALKIGFKRGADLLPWQMATREQKIR